MSDGNRQGSLPLWARPPQHPAVNACTKNIQYTSLRINMSPKTGLYFIRKIHLPSPSNHRFRRCFGNRSNQSELWWRVRIALPRKSDKSILYSKIMDKISFATQCYSVFHSLFLVFLHKKCLAMLCSVSFTIPGDLSKKKKTLTFHTSPRNKPLQPCFQLAHRALSALVRQRHIWWKDPTAMPRRRRLRGPPCLDGAKGERHGAGSSIGTASNDSNACFFWITRNEESQICSYTVLFFTGFSDASYSLSLFTQEASSTSSSVQYYYSWKKSKNKNFPVKSLMEGMNTNMGTFSPKEWLSLKLLTTRQIRSKPLNFKPSF